MSSYFSFSWQTYLVSSQQEVDPWILTSFFWETVYRGLSRLNSSLQLAIIKFACRKLIGINHAKSTEDVLSGLIFQSVLVGAHLIDYDQIRVIFTRSGSVDQTLSDFVNDLGDYFRLIGLHRIQLDILQLAWIGPPLVWDLLITTVLMFNALDSRKRCRFGSADGRISLGITIMFETKFLVTLVTFIVLFICLVLGGKVAIDFERMNTLYGGFDGFVTKLHTISIFCSLQHKVNDRLRLEQKFIISSQKTRDSALSGYGLGHSVGSGDPTYHRRQSTRKGPQAIQFPDFAETDLEVSEEDGSVVVEGSEENDFDEDNVDDETEEENTSVHATENLRINRLAPAIEDRNSAHLSQKQIELNQLSVEHFDVKFPEQAKIINHHHVAGTSATEGLASGPVVDCPTGLLPNLGLKIFEDPQELIDAQHHHIHPHHSHSNPNPNFKSAVSSPGPGLSQNGNRAQEELQYVSKAETNLTKSLETLGSRGV
ncbi:hypothetical protein PTTG_11793, partial [Puccinia triticina 1-1 BBBD Race 1]